MTVFGPLQQLIENATNFLGIERRCLFVEELLDVLVEVLEDKEEFIHLEPMNDVFKVNDELIVSKLLQNCDLTNGCAWDSIVAMVNFDFFNCNNLVRAELLGHVNDTVGALTKLGDVFEPISQLCRRLDWLIFRLASLAIWPGIVFLFLDLSSGKLVVGY